MKIFKKTASVLLAAAVVISSSAYASAFSYETMKSYLGISGYVITPVAPEANHIALTATDSSGKQNINAVEFNPKNAYTSLRAGLSAGYVYSTQTVQTIANNMSDVNGGNIAVAAVNGDFFNFGVGVPFGVFIDEGKILSTPPQYSAAFGITYDNVPFVARHGTILDKEFRIDGELCDVTGINVTHVNDGESLVLYTSDYARSTKTGSETYELRCRVTSGEVRHGETLCFTVEEIHDASGDDTQIGNGYVVLSAQGANNIAKLKKLKVGDELSMSFRFNEFWSNVKFAIGGGELLLQDGKIYSTADKTEQPRTSIGYRADGTVVMATFDGRQAGVAEGMSYKNAANAMKALGCIGALNLDGGGSTTFILRRPGEMTASVANSVSGSSLRQVANAAVLMNTAPLSYATKLTVSPENRLVAVGSVSSFSVTGAYDNNYRPYAVPSSVSWSTDSSNTIDQNGKLTASVAGKFNVIAKSGSAVGSASVEVCDTLSEIKADKTSVSAASGELVTITAKGFKSGKQVEMSQDLFSWSAPESLGKFEAPGKLRLAKDPIPGNVTVSFGGASLTIPVRAIVEPQIIDDFEADTAPLVAVSVGTKVAPAWKFETDRDNVLYSKRSLKAYYNFYNTSGSVGSYYMVANDAPDASKYHLSMLPTELSMMVCGDGSGVTLRSIIEDANGKQYTITYGNLDHTGWKYMTASVPQNIPAPIYVKVPVYLVSNPKKLTQGCLYFDRLRAVYGYTPNEDHTAPVIAKAWPSNNMVISARNPSVGIILSDDRGSADNAYINPDTVELWINGYACPDREFNTKTGKIAYTVKVPLKNGKHKMKIRARDYWGNLIVREWSFEVRG